MQKFFSIMSRCNLNQKYSNDSILRAKKRLNTLFGRKINIFVLKNTYTYPLFLLILQ